MTDQNTTFVSVTLDPESEARLVRSLTEAFNKAFAAAATQMEELTARMTRITTEAIKVVQTSAGKMGKEFKAAGTEGAQSFTNFEKIVDNFAARLQAAGRGFGVIISELQRVSQLERRSSIDATQAASDAARLQIAEIRNVGIQTNIEGQKAVVVARGVAKSRVLITQGMVRSIILLEKGLGATIQGVAKTAVSAVSKTFSGITGLFRKDTAGISSELARTNAAIQRGVKQGNTELTTGVRGSLSKREELFRSSFRTQEQIVTRSALRQQETLAGLRRGTQTGVLGAANRGLNIGALVGGFAVVQAARSTFKVGSEFVRGLAVLQAQLGLTEEQMKGVDALSVQLGNDISLPGVSALDAAQAIQILSKQFGSLGDGAIVAAENAAKGTLQLSRAVGASAEDTAGIIGAAVNVFGISADKAITVADAVAGAMTQAAGVSFEDFKTAFIQGATVFENFVGPAESANDVLLDFNTSLAVLAKSGLVGESAGAGLKQFFLSASKQSDKALALQDELAKRAGTTGRIFFDAAHKARPFSESLDLLRKSLRGMSDEQKTATLTTLFGVRAQTIATALIRESGDDYDAIRERISKQGLAAKIAAAQNTGFAGALDALKSVIETVQIQLFKKLNPALGVITLSLATLFNNIFSGTGAFALLRRGLLGVAVGMGAVIAAKGAVEVLKLLGTAAKLALTPFGAVLVAAGLLGAAISILSDRSEPFRKALGELGDRLKGLGGAVIGLVGRALSALGGVIERDVLPFLIQFVNFLSEHVVGAFDAVVRFITDKAIPAIKTAGEFIGRIASIGFRAVVDFIQDHVIPTFESFVQFVITTVIPVAVRVGGVFKGAFDTALEAVKGFWHTVEPILRPALEGFKTLGRAIAAIFTGGDFSQLGKGFSAVGSGITTSFSTIGKNLLGVLDRLWETLQTWFKTHFSGPQLISLGKGFLDLVEFIGNTLGKIVTSPTFVRAVALLAAGLAAAAVLVAGRFIEGFGKALLDHLPGLFKLVGGAILDGFVAIFHNPLIATGIALAIFAIFRVINLVKGFTKLGQDAGGGFTNGLKASFKGVKAQNNFLTSFFGGPQRVTRTYFEGLNKAFNTELGGVQKKLRALGSTTIVTPRTFDAAKKELRLIGSGFDAAAVKGLLARDTFKQVATGVTTAFSGLRQGIVGGVKGVVKGVGDALSATNAYNGPATSGGKAFAAAFRTSIAGSGKTIAAGLTGIGVALQETAAAQGKSVGAVLGSAIAKAAIGAVAAVVGFQAGKAEGAAGGSGILSALLTGVTAGTLTGSPIIGVVAGAATLLGAAFGRAGKAAQEMRDRIKELASSLGQDLKQAIDDGIITLDSLRDHKIDIGDLIGFSDKAREDAIEAFRKSLTTGEKKQLISFGIDLGGTADLLADFGSDLDGFRESWNNTFLDAAAASDEFKNRAGGDLAEIVGVLKEVAKPFGDKDLTDFIANPDEFGALSKSAQDTLANNTKFFNDFLVTAGKVTGSTLNGIAESFDIASTDIVVTGKKAATDLAGIKPFAGHGRQPDDPFLPLIAGAKKLGDEVLRQNTLMFLSFLDLGLSVDDAQAELAKVSPIPFDQTIIDGWKRDLDSVGKTIDGLQSKIDAAPGQIADRIRAALGGDVGGSLRGGVDQTLGDIVGETGSLRGTVDQTLVDSAGIAAAIQEAIDKGGVAGAAALRIALGGEADTIGQLLVKGITDGAVTNAPGSAEAFLEPVKQALIDGLNPDDPGFQAAKDNIILLFATAVQNLKPTIDAVHSAEVGKKFNEQVQQFLTDNPLTSKVDAELLVKLNTDQGFLTEGDARKFGIPEDTKTKILNQIVPTAEATKTAATKVGVEVPRGLTAGMKDPDAIAAMKAQVRSLANQALAQFKLTLGIKSPSTEMATIGGFMTQGLADGITAGAAAASTAAAAAAQAAVDAAKGVITDNPIPLPVSAQVPPQANIISGAEHDRLRALSVGRGVVGSAVQGTPAGQIDIGQAIASLAHFGSKITPGDDTGAGALQTKQELADLVTLARALVAAAEQMNKRGPDQTNLTIVEAKDARATGRAAIAELRADRMLLKGIR